MILVEDIWSGDCVSSSVISNKQSETCGSFGVWSGPEPDPHFLLNTRETQGEAEGVYTTHGHTGKAPCYFQIFVSPVAPDIIFGPTSRTIFRIYKRHVKVVKLDVVAISAQIIYIIVFVSIDF